MFIVGTAIKTIGELLLGVTVILVHHQIVADHRIDKKVLNLMHREQFLAGLGMVLIVAGYVIELVSYY